MLYYSEYNIIRSGVELITVQIPTIDDSPAGFNTLFVIYQSCVFENDIFLNFSGCTFLKQNAVAVLGGMIGQWITQNKKVSINIESIQPAVKKNLLANSFLCTMFPTLFPVQPHGNSIPFKQHLPATNDNHVADYLTTHFLGRGWIGISDQLKRHVTRHLVEIYTNTFEHSLSTTGVFSCGQHYPKLKELKLTVVDFGIGVPTSVRSFLNQPISDPESLYWAFLSGNTTRTSGPPGGLGLDLLKDFVLKNKGKIEMYSHNGYFIFELGTLKAEKSVSFFPGTIVNITLNCDSKIYYVNTEIF